jgi:hypothetical protein
VQITVPLDSDGSRTEAVPRPRPRKRGRATRYGLTGIFLLIIVVFLPLFILGGINGEASLAFLFNCAIIVYSGARLTFLAFNRRQVSLQLTFYLFVYCWFGLAAAAQVMSSYFPDDALRQSPENLLKTNLVIALGIAAYEAGLYSFNARPARERKAGLFKAPGIARFVALNIICLIASFYAIERTGGVSAALVTRHEAEEAAKRNVQSESLIYSALQHEPPLVALLVTVHVLWYRRYRGYRKRIGQIFLIILFAYNALANYPPSLPRVILGCGLLSVGLMLLGARQRIKPAFILVTALCLIVLFPYLDYYRELEGYTAADVQHPRELLIHKADYDAYQMLSNSVAAVEDLGIDYGHQILGAFLFFVPREAWPDKPYATGQTVGEYTGYRMVNLSLPLWGEFYYGGGVLLVAAGFFLYGYASAKMESACSNPSYPLMILLAYAAGFQIFLLRGSLLVGVAYSLPSAGLILCYILRLARDRRNMRLIHSAERDEFRQLRPGRMQEVI